MYFWAFFLRQCVLNILLLKSFSHPLLILRRKAKHLSVRYKPLCLRSWLVLPILLTLSLYNPTKFYHLHFLKYPWFFSPSMCHFQTCFLYSDHLCGVATKSILILIPTMTSPSLDLYLFCFNHELCNPSWNSTH